MKHKNVPINDTINARVLSEALSDTPNGTLDRWIDNKSILAFDVYVQLGFDMMATYLSVSMMGTYL